MLGSASAIAFLPSMDLDRSRSGQGRTCAALQCDTASVRAVAALMRLPVLTRYLVAGAVGAGLLGCVAGLVIGLLAYPPTAWFAIFELGIPAAIVGGLVGLISGSVAVAVRRSRDASLRP
jgi:hypothetical protein